MKEPIKYINPENFEEEELLFEDFHIQIAKDIQNFIYEKYENLNRDFNILLPLKNENGNHKISLLFIEKRETQNQEFCKFKIDISFVKGTLKEIEYIKI